MAAQCGYLRPHRKRKAIEAIRRFTNTPPENRYTVCKIGSGSITSRLKRTYHTEKEEKACWRMTLSVGSLPSPESHAATIVEGRRGIVAAWFGEPKRRIPIVAFGLAAKQKQAGQNHKWLRTVYWTEPNTPAGIPY